MLVLLHSDSASASSFAAAHPSAAHQQRFKCMQQRCAPSYGIASMRMQRLPQRRIIGQYDNISQHNLNNKTIQQSLGIKTNKYFRHNKSAHATFYDTSALVYATPDPGGEELVLTKPPTRRHAICHYKFGFIVCPYNWFRNNSETRLSYCDL